MYNAHQPHDSTAQDQPATIPLLAAALAYVERGWPVFPLMPGSKKPYKGTRGVLDATLDPEQVREWWTLRPRSNIAIAGGHGLMLLDEDTYKGADASPLLLPVTLSVQTPRGGLHRYFTYAGELGNAVEGKLAPGVGFRGLGYYVVAPPSVVGGKPYTWEDEAQPVAALPERIARMIRGEPRTSSSSSSATWRPRDTPDGSRWIDEAIRQVRSGSGRNDTGAWLACQLRDDAVSDPEGAMLAYAAAVRDDGTHPYTEREALATLRGILRRQPREPAKSQNVTPLRPRQAPPGPPTQPPEPPDDEEGGRPHIIAKDRQLRDITSESLAALEGANAPEPMIFWRGGALSRVRRDEAGTPLIDDLDEKMIRHRLTAVADFAYISSKGRHIPMAPTKDLVQDIMAQPAWPFPPLVGITESPVLRPDGSTLDTPGYDPATRLIYAPADDLSIPLIPAHPSQDDVRAALEALDEALGDFPYDGPASHAHALALLLTPVVRPAIRGHVPMALITAPAAGTGKGLLGGLAPIISSGREPSIMTAAEREEEWAKKITSTLLLGPSIILLDNIRGVLSSANLEAVLTCSVWTDRALGANKMVRLPQRAVWVATGNNLQLGGDLPRRCYRIRLDAQLARPERREGWRHDDLKAWAHEHRGELLAALLTLARAWYADGCPAYPVTAMGSYEEWARVVGCILAHAGVEGFLSNLDEMYEETDMERPQWGSFFAAWHDVYGADPKRANEVAASIVDGNQELARALPEALAPHIEKLGMLTRRLGYELRKQVRVRYAVDDGAEVFLDRAGEDRNHTAQWCVRKVAPPSPPAGDHPQPQNEAISGIEAEVRVIAGDALILRGTESGIDQTHFCYREGLHDHPRSPAPVPQMPNNSGLGTAGDTSRSPAEGRPPLDEPCPQGGKHRWGVCHDGIHEAACYKCGATWGG